MAADNIAVMVVPRPRPLALVLTHYPRVLVRRPFSQPQTHAAALCWAGAAARTVNYMSPSH